MAKVIDFAPMAEEPNIYEMDKQQLQAYLAVLEDELVKLDAREPRSQKSEAYEAWADEHEELEDYLDEILDRMEALCK